MGLLTPVAVKIGSITWLARLLPAIVWIDLRLQRLTRGRVALLGLAGLPNLLLVVPGRKSGIPRSTPLLCVPRAGSYLVAGSNWGGPKEPAWVANLEASLVGELRVKGRTSRFTARRLEGAERQVAWRHMNHTWPNFDCYEERSQRPIKVFELTPSA